MATASNASFAAPTRPSASASSPAVSFRAVRLTPRSRSLTDRVLTRAALANSSWVSPALARRRRRRPANVRGVSASAGDGVPFPSSLTVWNLPETLGTGLLAQGSGVIVPSPTRASILRHVETWRPPTRSLPAGGRNECPVRRMYEPVSKRKYIPLWDRTSTRERLRTVHRRRWTAKYWRRHHDLSYWPLRRGRRSGSERIYEYSRWDLVPSDHNNCKRNA